MTIKKILFTVKEQQENRIFNICPCCGTVIDDFIRNTHNYAVSRRTNLSVCSDCGTNEALEDMIHKTDNNKKKQIKDWFCIKHPDKFNVICLPLDIWYLIDEAATMTLFQNNDEFKRELLQHLLPYKNNILTTEIIEKFISSKCYSENTKYALREWIELRDGTPMYDSVDLEGSL